MGPNPVVWRDTFVSQRSHRRGAFAHDRWQSPVRRRRWRTLQLSLSLWQSLNTSTGFERAVSTRHVYYARIASVEWRDARCGVVYMWSGGARGGVAMSNRRAGRGRRSLIFPMAAAGGRLGATSACAGRPCQRPLPLHFSPCIWCTTQILLVIFFNYNYILNNVCYVRNLNKHFRNTRITVSKSLNSKYQLIFLKHKKIFKYEEVIC